MKLWFLDNEYSSYVIVADSEDDAWTKLRDKVGIMRPGWEPIRLYDGQDPDRNGAYHPMWEIKDMTDVNAGDVVFVL